MRGYRRQGGSLNVASWNIDPCSPSCDKAFKKANHSARDSSFFHKSFQTFSNICCYQEVKVVQIRDARTSVFPPEAVLVIVVVLHNDAMLWFMMTMITVQHSVISSCGWSSVELASVWCYCAHRTKCYGNPPRFNNILLDLFTLKTLICVTEYYDQGIVMTHVCSVLVLFKD